VSIKRRAFFCRRAEQPDAAEAGPGRILLQASHRPLCLPQAMRLSWRLRAAIAHSLACGATRIATKEGAKPSGELLALYPIGSPRGSRGRYQRGETEVDDLLRRDGKGSIVPLGFRFTQALAAWRNTSRFVSVCGQRTTPLIPGIGSQPLGPPLRCPLQSEAGPHGRSAPPPAPMSASLWQWRRRQRKPARCRAGKGFYEIDGWT